MFHLVCPYMALHFSFSLVLMVCLLTLCLLTSTLQTRLCVELLFLRTFPFTCPCSPGCLFFKLSGLGYPLRKPESHLMSKNMRNKPVLGASTRNPHIAADSSIVGHPEHLVTTTGTNEPIGL